VPVAGRVVPVAGSGVHVAGGPVPVADRVVPAAGSAVSHMCRCTVHVPKLQFHSTTILKQF
jgi:hypothetical protein